MAGLFLGWVSVGFTIEMETFVGLRENRAPIAVFLLVIAALCALAGAMLSARRIPRTTAVLTLCVVALLTWRTVVLAPMLPCWSHESVGRNEDGSYDCYDRF
ncbi:hypothetical protein [Streptomyces boluensis]|uniref:Uncharacterized protein n=1 Tax=Streptomyces boluensis TaxID=1775135 RepID=A0A964USV9_9ACTN|nr:hypothetical protein [Streptomyces boluensis]NBE53503.1 hypothetical protein [Streptomyces boluensis]